MKKFYHVGTIIPWLLAGQQYSESPDQIHWSIPPFSARPASEEDILLRSPLFHYASGDRYFTAELGLREGFLVCTRLSITRCSRDRHDFKSFTFAISRDTMDPGFFHKTGPDAHGGRFFIYDFKDRESRIVDPDGSIYFICYASPTTLNGTPDEMALIPYKNKKSRYEDVSTQTDMDSHAKNLGQNLENLMLKSQDHDLVLKVEDKEFRAHRCILRARSSVMHSMLSHDMIEKNSGVIDIPDCDPGAFEQFRIYVYSGKVETLDEGNMLALYCMADKYDVEHLKKQCREFIKIALTSINLLHIIQFASDHSDEELLEYATEYFSKIAIMVLRTAEWQSFSTRNPILANNLCSEVYDSLKAEKK